jgi:hypothetical protein
VQYSAPLQQAPFLPSLFLTRPCASTIAFCTLLGAMFDTLVLLSKIANLVVLVAPGNSSKGLGGKLPQLVKGWMCNW